MAEARAFVCGYPIKHSRSPLIHGYWLELHGIDGEYGAVEASPEEFFGLLERVRAGDFRGGNVTIPHKETAFAAVDRHDGAADSIGAVNTLWTEDGVLVGGNTDAYGFAANLDERAPGWASGNGAALVLGAGGAARAVLHALITRGFERIVLANRTLARGEELAGHFGPKVQAIRWDEAARMLGETALLVNTTSLGMEGGEALLLDLSAMPAKAVVTDLVYVPLETPLLKAAHGRSDLRVVDGLGMLLHQAVPGFERWFGVRPEVTEALRDLVIADLQDSRA